MPPNQLRSSNAHLSALAEQAFALGTKVAEEARAGFLAGEEMGVSAQPLSESIDEEWLDEQQDLDGRIPVSRQSRVFPEAVDREVQVAGLGWWCSPAPALICRWIVIQSFLGCAVNVLLKLGKTDNPLWRLDCNAHFIAVICTCEV